MTEKIRGRYREDMQPPSRRKQGDFWYDMRSGETVGMYFAFPGTETRKVAFRKEPWMKKPTWTFNGNCVHPTINESIKCFDGQNNEIWHGWIRSGWFVPVTVKTIEGTRHEIRPGEKELKAFDYWFVFEGAWAADPDSVDIVLPVGDGGLETVEIALRQWNWNEDIFCATLDRLITGSDWKGHLINGSFSEE